MNKKITEEEIETILNRNKFINSENELRRLPMKQEVEFLDKIRQGRYQDISVHNYSEIEKNMGFGVKERRRHFEYNTAAGIAVAARAAIEGGLNPDDAFDIGDTMMQKLEQAKTIDDMHDILELTGVVFARAVYNARKCKNSYLLEQCKIYISRNIFKKITLTDLAKYVGSNPSYLSRVFSQKEGITLQEYIQKEKVNVALNLLRYSDNSIAETAQYMGFQSQSNFSAVFKKWKHMSPSEYRNSVKKKNVY